MFTRLSAWISREITHPLESMYSRLDENLQDDTSSAVAEAGTPPIQLKQVQRARHLRMAA